MRRFATPALAALLCGCSPAYVYKSWRGHARLMSSRRPVAKVLADPATPARLREQLSWVVEARRFAFERIGIPPTENYTEFSEVPGSAATWIVSASRKLRLEPKLWWFPFLGRVPYKGHFERADADREREALEREGWDTFVGGASAYSTLRWFRDPVLSTMLDREPGELAELLLHELTHTAVFFKGEVDFNEALATYFGERGAEEFLASRWGPDSPQLAGYLKGRAEQEERWKALDELHGELERLYASPAPDSEKLERREGLFARYRGRIGLKALNNAVVLAHRRYRYDLEDFRKAHERLGGDWRKLLERMRALDRKDPRAALKRWLSAA